MEVSLDEVTMLPRGYNTLAMDPNTAGMADDFTGHVLSRVARPASRR